MNLTSEKVLKTLRELDRRVVELKDVVLNDEPSNALPSDFSDYDNLSDFENATDDEGMTDEDMTEDSTEDEEVIGEEDTEEATIINVCDTGIDILDSQIGSQYLYPKLSYLKRETDPRLADESATLTPATEAPINAVPIEAIHTQESPIQASPISTPLNSIDTTYVEENSNYYDAYAEQYISCMNANPTTYHFITHFKSVLDNNGFINYDQQKHSDLSKPGFYYTTLEDLSLVAFIKGGKWSPREGSCFVGTHVDAVGIKILPAGLKKISNSGYETVGVAPYSGPINELWVSRDLALAGSVTVKKGGRFSNILIDSKTPIGTIASIPEFLVAAANPGPNGKYNIQDNAPIIGFSSEDKLAAENRDSQTIEMIENPSILSRHSKKFLDYVAKLAGVDNSDISTFDLHLYDAQPATRGGLSGEFIYSSSLDDRLCSFDAMYGLLEFSKSFFQENDLDSYEGLVGVYFANHEEIGSLLRTGAQGGFLLDSLKGVVSSRKSKASAEADLLLLTTNTIFLSSDVTHCLNPNFRDVYLDDHMPKPNTGPTIKIDLNQHVLTDSIGHLFLQNLVEKYCPEIKLQQFHIRNDSRSGGTIGPIMSNGRRGLNGAKLVIDVGLPILSMHSVRGIMGAKDVGLGVKFFGLVFRHWRDVPSEIEYDY